MLNQIIPLLLVVLLGTVLRVIKFLNLDAGRLISRLVMYVTIPVVIFRAVSQSDIRPGLLWLVLLGAAVPLTTLLIGKWSTRASSGTTRGALLVALCGKNTDLFALPVIQAVYGLGGVSLLALVSMGNALCVFFVAFIMAAYFNPNRGVVDARKMVRSIALFPPILAFVAGLVFNLSGFSLPDLFLTFAGVVGNANVFLSLLVIGIFLDITVVVKQVRTLVPTLITKYAVALTMGIAFYMVFVNTEPLMASIGLIASLMPAPVVSLVYSTENNLDHKIAGAVVGTTTVISTVLLIVVSAFL
ncbi:MAG TPA: hypothetical protein DCE14_04970 [Kosmotogaceae bacterium]|nr:MAG: Auxin Efflux Carrier [Thermotogales bacterium 46_20]HAA85690.1 hypothetical protein [Kosmotogaceae bacterium]